MTSETVHGAPGSYKTCALIWMYALDALRQGRTVISNIRGFDSIERIEQVYDEAFPPGAELINVPFTLEGFEKMARWFHWAPHGSVILMDEGQRVYPTRLKTLSIFDNNDTHRIGAITVEEAFDTHRHFNYDIYISTTNIAKIHKEIRQICEFAYRHKNLKGLLPIPYFNGRFKRVKHDPENSGKSPTHYLGSEIKKIDTKVFKLYDSTATSKTKDTTSQSNLLQQPKMLLVLVIFGACIFWLGRAAFREGGLFPSLQNSKTVTANTTHSKPDKTRSNTPGTVATGDDYWRVTDQNNPIDVLLTSITHASAEITTNNKTAVWFETEHGLITSDELQLLNVTITRLHSYFLLEHNNQGYWVPTKLNVVHIDPRDAQQPTNAGT